MCAHSKHSATAIRGEICGCGSGSIYLAILKLIPRVRRSISSCISKSDHCRHKPRILPQMSVTAHNHLNCIKCQATSITIQQGHCLDSFWLNSHMGECDKLARPPDMMMTPMSASRRRPYWAPVRATCHPRSLVRNCLRHTWQD